MKKTILLVDDDLMVLKVTKKMLELLGYRVVEASNGFSAIELFKQMKEDIDLVIVDLIMADLNGEEVIYKINNKSPGTPILISSGSLLSDDIMQKMENSCDGCIQKPYDLPNLSKIVSESIQ